MHAAPRAASGSPTEALRRASLRLPPARRLRSPAQFLAVTSDPQALRAARRWLSVAGRVQPPESDRPPVRFGFTASRRHARRAVDRNVVKRVMREAARNHLGMLDVAAAGRSVDIVLRLKAALPAAGETPLARWKGALRREADGLLAQLAQRLQQGSGG